MSLRWSVFSLVLPVYFLQVFGCGVVETRNCSTGRTPSTLHSPYKPLTKNIQSHISSKRNKKKQKQKTKINNLTNNALLYSTARCQPLFYSSVIIRQAPEMWVCSDNNKIYFAISFSSLVSVEYLRKSFLYTEKARNLRYDYKKKIYKEKK